MSIIIPDMKMPEACEDCPLYSKNSSNCLAVEPPRFFDPHALAWREPKPGDELGDKPSWCPLLEVAPHGRLIDADALKIYQMEENVRADGDPNEYEYDAGLIDGLHIAAKDVSVAPTIIPAEGGADG